MLLLFMFGVVAPVPVVGVADAGELHSLLGLETELPAIRFSFPEGRASCGCGCAAGASMVGGVGVVRLRGELELGECDSSLMC